LEKGPYINFKGEDTGNNAEREVSLRATYYLYFCNEALREKKGWPNQSQFKGGAH